MFIHLFRIYENLKSINPKLNLDDDIGIYKDAYHAANERPVYSSEEGVFLDLICTMAWS